MKVILGKLLSVNVGLPSEIGSFRGKKVLSGIRKEPVTGSVIVRKLNLEGDRQADLTVHGGVDKAVYVYPSENYPFWKNKFPDLDIRWGTFGENFTTEGLAEDALHVGDRLQIGSAILMVRQSRVPCYKLAVKFQRDDILDRFLASGRSGFYFSVEQEGQAAAGDPFTVLSRNGEGISIAEMNRLFVSERYNRSLLQKAIDTAALPEDWREYFQQRLQRSEVIA